MSKYPPRLCAICDRKIPYEFRTCKPCKQEYGNQMDTDWFRSLLEATNQDYNHRVWSFKHAIPIEWID